MQHLDLKFVSHHGEFIRHKMAGREELAGRDVILGQRGLFLTGFPKIGLCLIQPEFAGLPSTTLAYAEKVRPQVLSLRQHFRSSASSMGGMAANPSINLGLSKNQTVLETAELGDLLPGDAFFS